MAVPDVSVLIVTWNSARFIGDCLDSLLGQTEKASHEIIVIDNASDDQTREIIKRRYPDVRLLEMPLNLGFPKANNLGMASSSGRYLFLLNPDVRFESDVLGILKDFMDDHPDAALAGPKVLEADGETSAFSAREFPTLRNMAFRIFALTKLFPQVPVFSAETMPDWDRNTLKRVPYLNGAAVMIRRSLIEEIGALNEEIPMYYEDLELSARAHKDGRPTYYVPEAVLTHLGAQSASLSPQRRTLIAMEDGQAPWLYFRDYQGRAAASIFRSLILVGNAFRILGFWIIQLTGRFPPPELKKMKALALLRWSLTPKKRFDREIERLFPNSPSRERK